MFRIRATRVPRFDRSLNTGGPAGAEVRGQVALNTVVYGAARPSRVLLPVVDHGVGH